MTATTARPHAHLRIAIFGALVLVASLLAANSATASHSLRTLTGSNFEIDTNANIVVDDSSPKLDWASVLPDAAKEDGSGRDDDSFGQGTKEDTAHPTVVSGSIPPNKSDLRWFGVHQEGSTTSGFLNLFWSRVLDPVGTTNMDFEFNATRCLPTSPSTCAPNGLTPLRSIDDVLITYDLAKGGTVPKISMRLWDGSRWGPPDPLDDVNDPNADAAGSINTSEIEAGDAHGLGKHSPLTFGEAQIRLSSIFSGPDCRYFGSAYLKSRASDSFTAALKDFVAPMPVEITNCLQPTITTAQSFYPQDSATITVGSGLGNLTGTVRFRLYDSLNCSGTALLDQTRDLVTDGTGTALQRTVSTANTTYSVTTSKTLSWLVEFESGNTGHNDVTSVCDKERITVDIVNNNPTPGQ